jgi:hypothetical protein
MFLVKRYCDDGCCLVSDGRCECIQPTPVGVDELTIEELEAFAAEGTLAQQAEIDRYLEEDPIELYAGQPDRHVAAAGA